ncbi:hypothetical protein, partial [Mesomycoplasma ovipneumoniae]|uniref:hypothetical protein n=1 Tax=Mesomycoplasma ovipneumoniae TaxID=29562 RepID=UPI0030806301
CYQMLLIKLRFYIKKTPIYGCFFIFIFTKKWIFVLKLGNSGMQNLLINKIKQSKKVKILTKKAKLWIFKLLF